MPTYDSRSISDSIQPAPNFILMMLGNRNRVALNVSSNGTAVANVALILATTPSDQDSFVWITPGTHLSLPYRDWGPVIKEPIYAANFLGVMDVLLNETFVIPRFIGV